MHNNSKLLVYTHKEKNFDIFMFRFLILITYLLVLCVLGSGIVYPLQAYQFGIVEFHVNSRITASDYAGRNNCG